MENRSTEMMHVFFNMRDRESLAPTIKRLMLALLFLFVLNNAAFAQEKLQVKKVLVIKSTSTQSFDQPSNFTLDTAGNIYLLDDLSDRVLVYDRNGDFKFTFGGVTNKDISLYKTYNIDFDDYNNIHIFDSYSNAVLVFDSAGKLKKSITFNFDDKLKHNITDLAFSYDSYYLLDNENSYLYIFDTRGHITKRIGQRGELQEEFRNPFSLAFDLEGRIYVTDVLNSRIQVFASTGTYLSQIGKFGFVDGGILRPNGVAVDGNKNVFISDAYLGVIHVFKADGTYVSPVMEGDKVLKLKAPSRLKIFEDKLYVLEMTENAVSAYIIL